MKKMFVAMIVLMAVLMMAVTAIAGDYFRKSSRNEAYELVKEWAAAQGYDEYVNEVRTYEELKFCGVFSIDEAKAEFEIPIKYDIYDIFIAWKAKVKEVYNADISITLKGDINGWNVYNVEGIQDGKNVSIMFMVYDEE